jgi:hypothetical protein
MRRLIILSSLLLGCNTDNSSQDTSEYSFEIGPEMQPGVNCLSCHRENSSYPDAPIWSVGGTVFAGPDSEVGANGVTVTVVDYEGTEIEMTTNAAGNFYTATPLVLPYEVTVSDGTHSAIMPASPPAGSCNACHSTNPVGGAPGAIYVPTDTESFIPAGSCADESTYTVDGSSFDCSPYVCTDGMDIQCLFSCETNEDCSGEATCDLEGVCVE